MRSSADRASAHCKWHKCTLSASRMLTESFVTLQNASSNSSNHNRCHNLPGNRRKSWLRSTKNDNSSCERAHAIFCWASTIFCWASTCQFLITRLLIGQRASYNRFFHWLFPDANDGSNNRTKDHRSFPNMKLPAAAIKLYTVAPDQNTDNTTVRVFFPRDNLIRTFWRN